MINKWIDKLFNYIDDFMGKESPDTMNTLIIIFSFLILVVIIGVLLFLINNIISVCYIFYILLLFYGFTTLENYGEVWYEKTLLKMSIPFGLLFILTYKIIFLFLPYRGNDPMLIRKYKVRTLKRKARINKIKFWKR